MGEGGTDHFRGIHKSAHMQVIKCLVWISALWAETRCNASPTLGKNFRNYETRILRTNRHYDATFLANCDRANVISSRFSTSVRIMLNGYWKLDLIYTKLLAKKIPSTFRVVIGRQTIAYRFGAFLGLCGQEIT